MKSLDFNLVNLCVALNALGFNFTVAQTSNVILDFESTLEVFRSEKIAAKRSRTLVLTFQVSVESQTVAHFHRLFLARGYNVGLGDVADLFHFLFYYNMDFRHREFRAWCTEKRRRREARERRRKHITANYRRNDPRYHRYIDALEAEMKEDCEHEADLLGLELVLKGTWTVDSTIVIPHHYLYQGKMFAYSYMWPLTFDHR